jgi:hypothetical protein
MLKSTLVIALLAAAICSATAHAGPYADGICSYTLGVDGGYGLNYLPGNICGPPDFNFNEFRRDVLESEIFSLGIGGSAVVEFRDNLVVDGLGVDFTVFENGLIDLRNGRRFYEGAEVFASADGLTFFDLGYAQGAMTGMTYNAIYDDPSFNPLDPAVSGGDSFDIAIDKNGAATGLVNARYVKLVDDGDGASSGAGSSGFDLDAIAAVHSVAIPEANARLLIGAAFCGLTTAIATRARRGFSMNKKEN